MMRTVPLFERMMIESFERERETGGASLPRALGKAAAEARPRAEWPTLRDALKLHKGSPERVSEHGDAKLRIAAAEPPPGTRMALPPSPLGAAFRWTIDPAVAQAAASRRAPDVTISLERGEATWPLLRLEPRFDTHELLARWVPGSDEPALAGRVMAYWSPDGERVLLVIEVDGRPATAPPLQERSWALRAVGPQIRLVEAGAGQPRVRALAASLAAAGMPVANAELRASPSAESKLLHAQDREGAAAVAERIRALLPVPLTPEATKLKRTSGDVVVMLGYDAQ